MAMAKTGMTLALRASRGSGFRNKKLAFCLGTVGITGPHRVALREKMLQRIDRSARDGFVDLRISVNGKPLTFSMRQGNEDDYKIGGELVRGAYQFPNFTPDQIVDCGANIGMFTLHASSYFPDAHVICYEP